MSEVLVLVETDNGAVKKVSKELLTLARGIGEPAAVVTEAGIDTAALAEFGAATVYVAEAAPSVLDTSGQMVVVHYRGGSYMHAGGAAAAA